MTHHMLRAISFGNAAKVSTYFFQRSMYVSSYSFEDGRIFPAIAGPELAISDATSRL